MPAPHSAPVPTLAEAAQWAPERVVELAQAHEDLQRQVQTIQHQLEWFRRQLFGQKSEKRLVPPDPAQMHLGELPIPESQPDTPGKTVAGHTRRASRTDYAQDKDESALFFDETRVPVETITLANPETEGLTADQFEVIGEKVSHRLAQRPGSYVILKYVRPVIKRRDTQTIHCPAAPVGVIEGSRADVSFLVGLLLDKFAWHLPLYRQHQRLADAGITVSRAWLTQLAAQAAALLVPIYEAQLASIRASRVKAMDETPIKAGRAGPGKMKGCYFWPVYGELHEICFPFFDSRAHSNVEKVLGLEPAEGSVLLSDGYGAYETYASKTGLTHAQCWTHCRREFINAEAAEPELAAKAIAFIGALYAVEAKIRDDKLKGEAKREYRLDHARPIVAAFFTWVKERLDAQGLLPTNPLTKALIYAHKRRAALEVFLADPDVPIDTNHLERALRPIPIGRKNWMFSWTELGAQHVGVVQNLITTCRLHEVDPYDYLVDVLQRVGQHPAADVAQLTPRLWKEHFGKAPLRSDISSPAA
ncbi:IS66 family transposase [Thauera sp. SWB20]|uniref:IS66 family transposase n=1 Tax=Thauera sp. SWB20 TaxID=1572758 RepID=UPI0005ADF47B|nr:IS66 family transposase [Thauera sp. SWB20]KIN90294.1 transposase IS66 family protein [Thauera sp. SWB20]